MQRTNWFGRKFPPVTDNGIFPCILERLEGTAARLHQKFAKITGNLTAAETGKWSIQKELGHLIDLEPLWLERAFQIVGGQPNLAIADLTNRKTHETAHDAENVADLLRTFEMEREKLVEKLRQTTGADLEKSAIHPRLGTPMRLIDLAFFVAEHDDHHLAQITFLEKN